MNKVFPWVKGALALVGLLSLLFQAGSWLYRVVSMQDVVAFVVPICERYVFGPTDEVSLYSSKEWKYVGMRIFALNPVINPRVRFSDVFSVTEWGMYSDGLSDAEVQAFLSKLPIGKLPSEFVTPPLPDLPVETWTTLMMIGQPLTDEYCGKSHVEMTATQGDIYHAGPLRFLREPPFFSSLGGLLVVAFCVFLFATLLGTFVLAPRVRHKWPRNQ